MTKKTDERHQVTPMRFGGDVRSVCKLPNHEVLVSLRNIGGETRKVKAIPFKKKKEPLVVRQTFRAPLAPQNFISAAPSRSKFQEEVVYLGGGGIMSTIGCL